MEEGVKYGRGRYTVSMPDLVERLDTLSSLRGKRQLLLDLRRGPNSVREKLSEINRLYFKYFEVDTQDYIRRRWRQLLLGLQDLGSGQDSEAQARLLRHDLPRYVQGVRITISRRAMREA